MNDGNTETLNISHFKAFAMKNLQYEIKIHQKIYNGVTITENVYYEIYLNRLYYGDDNKRSLCALLFTT